MMAAIAFFVLIVASILNLWAKMLLLHRYRVDDYLSDPKARLLYWSSRVLVLLVGLSVVTLSNASRLWWIEIPAWLLFALILWLVGWGTYMRLSGKYVEYYRARQWR